MQTSRVFELQGSPKMPMFVSMQSLAIEGGRANGQRPAESAELAVGGGLL